MVNKYQCKEMGDRIRKRRKGLNMTQEDLAFKVGYKSRSSINKIELGLTDIGQTMIAKIADALFTTPAFIMGDNELSKPHTTKIPVLGYVRAGIPIEAVEEILDYEEITPEMARQGEYFGLKIKGSSMEPRFREGDVVIVRKQSTVDNGQIAVVLVNGGDATVKRFYGSEAGVQLVATNPAYEPLFFTPAEVENKPVKVIGKVVELRAKF